MTNRTLPVSTVLAERPVFLVSGLHKSGTTWVQSLLDAHPEIACRTEDRFAALFQMLQPVFQRYNERNAAEDKLRADQGTVPFDDDDIASIVQFTIRRALAKAPDDVKWSGIKDNVLNSLGFLRVVPKSVVIGVARDPRDLAISSWASIRRHAGKAEERVERPPIEHMGKILETCRLHIGELEKRLAGYPDRVHCVRYEDLADDFDTTVRALLAFLDVTRDDQTIGMLRAATDFATLAGGRAPGQEDARSFWRKGRPGTWRDHFTAAELAPVVAPHAEWMARWGYGTEA